MKRSMLLLVTLLALGGAACTHEGGACQDLATAPGCRDFRPPPPPPPPSPPLSPLPGALEIASFSVLAVEIPGECEIPYPCLVPVVDLVENSRLGRGYLTSITVLGYKMMPALGPRSCPVEPGQRASVSPGYFSAESDHDVGKEKPIVVTFDDGTGVAGTLSGKTLVTPGNFPTTSGACQFGSAVPVRAPAAKESLLSR